MQNYLNFVEINPDILPFLVIDIVLAVALLGAMRLIAGISDKVNTTEELSQRDNFAFGISVAGNLAALGIVLSGAVTGGTASNLLDELVGMSLYGLLGIVLIKIGATLYDKVSLDHINKVALIHTQNTSVALVDAGAVIASAIIIRSVLVWVEGLDLMTFVAIVGAFFIAQLVLLIVTRLRENQYAKDNQGQEFQKALAGDQTAIAIRHIGGLIGTAIAVSTASQLLIYDTTSIITNLLGWLIASVALTLILSLLATISKRLVLSGINLAQEVDHQENIGVASIEMVITITVAMIINGLLT